MSAIRCWAMLTLGFLICYGTLCYDCLRTRYAVVRCGSASAECDTSNPDWHYTQGPYIWAKFGIDVGDPDGYLWVPMRQELFTKVHSFSWRYEYRIGYTGGTYFRPEIFIESLEELEDVAPPWPRHESVYTGNSATVNWPGKPME